MLVLNVDGGSRGNPGPAGYGVVVSDDSGKVVQRLKGSVGHQTNNYAEYCGLLEGLRFAQSVNADDVLVLADSELMVRQMNGRYQVRSEGLRPLFVEASELARSFKRFRIRHVPRGENSEADRLANLAMDEASSGRGRRSSAISPAAGSTIAQTPEQLSGVVRDRQVKLQGSLPWPEGTPVVVRKAEPPKK